MKIKIKFLVAFSCICLSCTKLNIANILAINVKNEERGNNIRQASDNPHINAIIQMTESMDNPIPPVCHLELSNTKRLSDQNDQQKNKKLKPLNEEFDAFYTNFKLHLEAVELFKQHKKKYLFTSYKDEMYQLCYLILKYQQTIETRNKKNYKPKIHSLCLYLDNHEKYHNIINLDHHKQFYDYFNETKDTPEWVSNIAHPLALAVFLKSPELVSEFIEYLVNKGITIDINKEVLFKSSLFDYVIATHDTKMFEILIKEAPKVHCNGKDKALDLSSLVAQVIRFGILKMLKCLICAGADLNWLYNSQHADGHGNPFWLTIKYDRKDMAHYLLDLDHRTLIKPINWNQEDEYGRTALMSVVYARYPGWARVLHKLLSKNNINIQAIDKDGRNIFMLLLERYIDIYTKYNNGEEFSGGYNLKVTGANAIFEQLCQDKNQMLKYVFQEKSIKQMMNSVSKEDKQTQEHIMRLVEVLASLQKHNITSIGRL